MCLMHNPGEEPIKKLVIAYLNVVFGIGERSENWWTDDLRLQLAGKFEQAFDRRTGYATEAAAGALLAKQNGSQLSPMATAANLPAQTTPTTLNQKLEDQKKMERRKLRDMDETAKLFTFRQHMTLVHEENLQQLQQQIPNTNPIHKNNADLNSTRFDISRLKGSASVTPEPTRKGKELALSDPEKVKTPQQMSFEAEAGPLIIGTDSTADVLANIYTTHSDCHNHNNTNNNLSLRADSLCYLFARVSKMLGLKWTQTAASEYRAHPYAFNFSQEPFDQSELEELEMRIKNLNIMALAKGYALKTKMLRDINQQRNERDLHHAHHHSQQPQFTDEQPRHTHVYTDISQHTDGEKGVDERARIHSVRHRRRQEHYAKLAIKQFREALEAHTTNAEALMQLADVHCMSDKPEKAKRYYLAALQMDPTNFYNLLKYAEFLAAIGNADEAEAQYETACAHATDNTQLHSLALWKYASFVARKSTPTTAVQTPVTPTTTTTTTDTPATTTDTSTTTTASSSPTRNNHNTHKALQLFEQAMLLQGQNLNPQLAADYNDFLNTHHH
eukprot:TRINITY_DN1363_c3_g1_i1.p1 TRINITY_DN1363_c3_g1~~TRINITY_DN1363_c3_g1_i1.p1  ORF type:complete len:559 (-),score=165.57 TRINITY_DN1363_c3_g1_i1:55-1731(-)